MTTQVNLILTFLWAFTVSVFAIPSIIHVAHLKNLLDEPNHRTMHVSLTPRLGGLAVFAGFISAVTVFGDITNAVQEILAGSLLLFFIGMKDDVVSISAAKKFFVQVISASIVVFMGDVRITNFQGFLFIYEIPVGISYGFSFLAIIGITNAINLIDGLDGLAGSIITTISAVFGVYFFTLGYYAEASLAVALMGAVVGFLRYNITKAIIFMGDTGSLVCGFLVSVLAIRFMEMKATDSAPAIALAVLSVPVFDTIRVFSVRIMRGTSPFAPDKNHVHHILTKAGLTQLQTVITLVMVNLSIAGVVILFRNAGSNILVGLLVGFFLLSFFLLEYMDKRNKKRAEANSLAKQHVMQASHVNHKQSIGS